MIKPRKNNLYASKVEPLKKKRLFPNLLLRPLKRIVARNSQGMSR